MPTIQVNGAKLYYEEHGAGAETIVFSHGLLWSGYMFHAQVAALQSRFRCITFDFRGQGGSEVTRSGYDMETLYTDALALIEALHAAPCHFVGLSMGGFIGMRIASRRPELLRSLTLIETSADPEPVENIPKYRQLAAVARLVGLRPVAGRVMLIMFGRTFMTDPARAAERKEWQGRMGSGKRIGTIRALNGVIERKGVYDEIGRITTPTLVIVGEQDVATVPAKAQRIAERIPGAQLVTIPDAGHTSSVEQPEAINQALIAFLNERMR